MMVKTSLLRKKLLPILRFINVFIEKRKPKLKGRENFEKLEKRRNMLESSYQRVWLIILPVSFFVVK